MMQLYRMMPLPRELGDGRFAVGRCPVTLHCGLVVPCFWGRDLALLLHVNPHLSPKLILIHVTEKRHHASSNAPLY